jgi:hypothetical protein
MYQRQREKSARCWYDKIAALATLAYSYEKDELWVIF